MGHLRPADRLLITPTGASVRQLEQLVPCRGNRQSPGLSKCSKLTKRHSLQGYQGPSTSCQAWQRLARQVDVRSLPCPCIQGRLCAVKAPSSDQIMDSAALHLSENHSWWFRKTPEAPLSRQNTPLLAAAEAKALTWGLSSCMKDTVASSSGHECLCALLVQQLASSAQGPQ